MEAEHCALSPPATPKRILFCQLRQIGDVIISTICIEMLANAFPEAEIHFLTEQKCTPILENNPHIAKVWSVDKTKLSNLLRGIAFYRKVASNDFDLVVNCQHLPRCTWVVMFSRAKRKLALNAPWNTRWLYTNNTSISTPSYAGMFKSKVLKPLGLAWKQERPKIYLTDNERATARNFFHRLGSADAPVISVGSTHHDAARRWPAKHYAALLDAFGAIRPDLRFFLAYGPGEKADAEAVRALSKYPERLLLPEEATGLRHLAACIERCIMHIGNCSAPRHMAVALGVPSLAFVGASSLSWTFPSPEHVAVSPRMKNSLLPEAIKYTDALDCMDKLTPELALPKLISHFDSFALKSRRLNSGPL